MAAVDLHCHLDLYADPKKAVLGCRDSGAYVLSVTTTPKAWRGTLALAKGVPRIRTSLGFHPQIAHHRIRELPLFEGLLPETRYVGEVGLDGGPESKPHWKEQTLVFDRILELASKAGGRILTIHSRRAASEVLDALERHPDAGIAVLHWFTGTKAELDRAAAMGCWFSVGSAMVRSQRGRDLIANMPRDRLLTETDGPFGTDQQIPLEPADVRKVVELLARNWRTTWEATEKEILSTFKRLASSAVGGPKSVVH